MRKFNFFILLFLVSLFLAPFSAQAGEIWSHYEPGNCLFGGDILVRNQCQVLGATPFILEGATIDDYETSIAVTDPTADRTITLPNDSGTVMLGGSAVKTISVLEANVTIASIASQTCSDVAITVTGAAIGDAVDIGPPAALESNLSVCGFVSAANTTKIRLCNPTASAIDPADTNSWRVTVFHY